MVLDQGCCLCHPYAAGILQKKVATLDVDMSFTRFKTKKDKYKTIIQNYKE